MCRKPAHLEKFILTVCLSTRREESEKAEAVKGKGIEEREIKSIQPQGKSIACG